MKTCKCPDAEMSWCDEGTQNHVRCPVHLRGIEMVPLSKIGFEGGT